MALSFLLLSLLLCMAPAATAQDSVKVREAHQHLRLDITGGYGVRLVDEKLVLPPDLGYDDGAYAGMARLSWKPEHMMAIGIQSGYMPISRISGDTVPGAQDGASGTIQLSAIPVFLVVTVWERYGFEISGGLGAYSLHSTGLLARGGEVRSQAWDIGYMGSIGWTFQPDDFPFGIGVNVQVMEFTDRPITILMPGLRLRWRVFEW